MPPKQIVGGAKGGHPIGAKGECASFISKKMHILLEDAYPSFANDPLAKAYLNEVDDVIYPDYIDNCTIDIVMIYS